MRKRYGRAISRDYKIMVVDDEEGIVDAVTAMIARSGYWCKGLTDPLEALAELGRERYDMLILDYFMAPIHGDEVVERIRKTDHELYILLLTGHKDLAPPVSTLRSLDIQAYCEKSDRTDQLQLLVESGVKSIGQMRIIKRFQDGFNGVLAAAPKIYRLQPLKDMLDEILRQMVPLVGGKDAFVIVDGLPASSESGAASETDVEPDARRSAFRGIGRYRAADDLPTGTVDHELMEAVGKARADGRPAHAPEGVALPLSDERGHSLGVMYVRDVSTEYDVKLLEIYAHQAASSISNAFLHSLVKTKNDELHETYARLKQHYMDTIEVLRLAVDAKDEYTRGHSDRVADLSVSIGRACGLDGEELEELRVAGLFHDIGKIGTADDILLKDDALDDAEYEEIKLHPAKGAMILSAVSAFESIVPVIRHHHERFDGNGYPDGVAGQDIELGARIVTVADAFDAMTSDRRYRSHLSVEEAIRRLRAGSGTQFDPEVVARFLELIEEDPGVLDVVRR